MQLNESLKSKTPYRLDASQIDLLAESIATEFKNNNRAAVASVITINSPFLSPDNHIQMGHGSLKGSLEDLHLTRRAYLLQKLNEHGVCLALTKATPERALRRKLNIAA